MFPFVTQWNDSASHVATDVSYLNAMPAGKNGFIVVKDGHFVESHTGRRIRFLGTNFTFNSDFPTHDAADQVAAHIAKMGINIVRIHHEDSNGSPLWDKSAPGHTKFNPASVDRLDYLISQFKKNGIYVDLNLHVSRKFVPEDGFPASVKDTQGEFDKRIDNLDRHMIDLQKQYAHDYLAHVNPYTGLSYADDPVVAIVEINNENSLVGYPGSGVAYCDTLPEPFRGEVVAAWNDWLAHKYLSTAKMTTSWFSDLPKTPSGPPDLLGPNSQWSLEDRTGSAKLTPSSAPADVCAPDFEVDSPTVSSEAWHTQAHIVGLNLVDGQYYTLSFRAKADAVRRMPVYTAVDQEDWHQLGLNAQAQLGTDWKQYRYTFQASRTVPKHSRISFVFGGDSGSVWLADVRLNVLTDTVALDPGISLEARNLNIPTSGSPLELADWNRFLAETEAQYAHEMRSYLRKDLAIHANIVDTQVSYGGLSSFNREANSDFADNHEYWQHPSFPGKPWDAVNWNIKNTPMADALAQGDKYALVRLAAYRFAGKPYTVSEYNHPAPSDYQAEMFPEIATFAALQDWDAIFQFDYGSYGGTSPTNKIQGFFAMEANPAKEGFLPAAALIFRCGELKPAFRVATLRLPASAPFSGGDAFDEWTKAAKGASPNIFSERLQAMLDDSISSSKVSVSGGKANSSVRAVKTPAGAQYIAIGDSAVALAGFVGGQTIVLGKTSLTFPAFGNNFAAMTLNALDLFPIDQSKHMLLTITGQAANEGMIWNESRTSLGRNWGHGPAQAEGIPATVTITNSSVKHVWPLDPTGARLTEAPATTGNGNMTFHIGPEFQTIWYEIAE